MRGGGPPATAIGCSLRRCGVSAMALCSTGTLMGPTELDFSGPGNDEAAAIRNRLAALRAEQAALQARLAELDPDRANIQSSPLDEAPVTASSSPAEKIALFRSLFRGREDVFPKRWSNPRSGRSGYAPACANEWAPRICDKPRIKCRECPNQAFIPVSAEVIDRHLRGRGADGPRLHHRRLPDVGRRDLLVPGHRFRQEDLAPRRSRLPGDLSSAGGCGGAGTIALRQRRPRVDLLH